MNLKIKWITLLLIIANCLIGQSEENEYYIFTRIGNNTWNELNLGIGFNKGAANNFEVLIGLEWRSRFRRQDCIFNFPLSHFQITRTNIQGFNIRTSFYPGTIKRNGIILLTRYGNAKGQIASDCFSSTFDKWDEELFDVGVLYSYKTNPNGRFNFIISPGLLFRSSTISNFRTVSRADGTNYTDGERKTKRFKFLLEWGLQINLFKFK